MEPLSSSASSRSALPADPAEKIRHLPADARAAFADFRASGDATVLDPLIFAMLESYSPRQPVKPLAEHPADTRLMDDLGFDSLAIAEVVFFTEDLFDITIANEEIIQVRTLDDLRGFIRRKVTARLAA